MAEQSKENQTTDYTGGVSEHTSINAVAPELNAKVIQPVANFHIVVSQHSNIELTADQIVKLVEIYSNEKMHDRKLDSDERILEKTLACNIRKQKLEHRNKCWLKVLTFHHIFKRD